MTENKMRKETNEEWNSLYEATFDGIKAPYELYRKVADMKNSVNRKTSLIKKGVIAAAVALSVVVGSNLAVYAATGTGWLGRIMVSWSSEEKEVVFREEVNPNGETKKIEVYNQEEDFTAGLVLVTPLPEK